MLLLQNRRNRKRRASEALEDPPKPAFDISHIPIEKLWEIFTPTFQQFIELRWPGQDVDERMRNIRVNTSTEDIINLAKMGPAVLSEWRANRRSGPRQSTSGSGRFLGLLRETQLNIILIAIDIILADSASERSSTAVATISSKASSNTRRSATVIPDPQPQPTHAPPQAVQVVQKAETVKAEDVEMADATPGPISTPKPAVPIPSVVQSALTPVSVPIPAPVAVATPQAMAPAAPTPSTSLPQSPFPNMNLDPDVDQAIIYELRDKTMTEIFTLKQDNAKATSAYTWTMRSHAFE